MQLQKHQFSIVFIILIIICLSYGEIQNQSDRSSKDYVILKVESSNKGGSISPLKKPKYTWFKVYAALDESISVDKISESYIKDILRNAVSDIRTKYNPDAVNVWLYLKENKIGNSRPIGKIDWWPKNHSLSQENAENINNKDDYVITYSEINLPSEFEPKSKTLSNYSETERKKIFQEIVRAEDRAESEAEIKYPTNPEHIPFNALKNYDLKNVTAKHFELVKELEKNYVNQILKKYGLSEEDKTELSIEAIYENWPLP